jgi:hypothetical protein
VQLLVGVDGLGCIKQVFHELAAQIHIHLLKGAFAVHEPLEMLVYVLPLDILAVSQSFEIGKEIALHLGLVKKAVVFIENGFVALVAQDDRFLHHACVEVPFLLVCRFGEDVNS